MSLIFTSTLTLVKGKFLKCLSSLKATIDFSEDAASDQYFIGATDYDPITSESFLEELCVEFSSHQVNIYYLDIDLAEVVKTDSFYFTDRKDDSQRFRCEHSGLHNAAVEGSYFAHDNNHAWSIFYDAAEDISLLHIEDISKIDAFKDSLLP